MAFQITRLELDAQDQVISARPVLPMYELHEHAVAIAGFEAARCSGEYGYDAKRDCWWGIDQNGRRLQFVIEPLSESDIAA